MYYGYRIVSKRKTENELDLELEFVFSFTNRLDEFLHEVNELFISSLVPFKREHTNLENPGIKIITYSNFENDVIHCIESVLDIFNEEDGKVGSPEQEEEFEYLPTEAFLGDDQYELLKLPEGGKIDD